MAVSRRGGPEQIAIAAWLSALVACGRVGFGLGLDPGDGGLAGDARRTGDGAVNDGGIPPGPDAPPTMNLIPSSDLAATLTGWTQCKNCQVVQATRPDGTIGSVLSCTNAASPAGYFRHGAEFSLPDGVVYTLSFFFRNIDMVAPFGGDPHSLGTHAANSDNYSFETEGGLNQADPYAGGWYRQALTFTARTAPTWEIGFTMECNYAPFGSFMLFGFQLEEGATLTPYTATP